MQYDFGSRSPCGLAPCKQNGSPSEVGLDVGLGEGFEVSGVFDVLVVIREVVIDMNPLFVVVTPDDVDLEDGVFPISDAEALPDGLLHFFPSARF